MEPTVLPEGLSLRSREVVGHGVVETYENATGERELSPLSGVGGETAGADTGRRIRIRGYEARELFVRETDTGFAVWLERDPAELCHQYTVIGVGLTLSEWDAVLAGIR